MNEEQEFKDLMFSYIESNNLNIYRIKSGTFVISKRKTKKDIDFKIAKQLIELNYYSNWRLDDNNIDFFKYMYLNLSKEGKEKLLKFYYSVLPENKCFDVLMDISEEVALNYIKNKKQEAIIISSKTLNLLEPKEFDKYMRKIVKIAKNDGAEILDHYIEKNLQLNINRNYTNDYKFILKKLIEDNFDKEERKIFRKYNLKLKEEYKRDYLIKDDNEELFMIRINPDIYHSSVYIETKPEVLHKTYDQIIDNIVFFLANSAKEFQVFDCEKRYQTINSNKVLQLLIYTEKNAYKNKQEMEKFITQAIEIQAESPELLQDIENVEMLFKNLYLIGDLNKRLQDKIPTKTEKNKHHKI